MRSLLVAAVLGSTLSLLPAQTASYTVYGSGCQGTGGTNTCLNVNGNQTVPNTATHNTNIFALEGTTTKNEIVFGFELLTRSTSSTPQTVKIELYYADSAGRPLFTPATTGTMVIGTAPGWYGGQFQQLQIMQPNTKFFLSYTSTTSMVWTFLPTNSTAQLTIHYWHPPTATNVWNGPFTTQRWAWRLICAGGGGNAVPQIGNTGLPKINSSFSMDLSKGRASSTAILVFGVSNTKWNSVALPLSLAAQGAPGCNLLASLDALLFLNTDGNGDASLQVQIPNSQALLGAQLYNQWAVVDGGANAWGMAFSAGGALKVGL